MLRRKDRYSSLCPSKSNDFESKNGNFFKKSVSQFSKSEVIGRVAAPLVLRMSDTAL